MLTQSPRLHFPLSQPAIAAPAASRPSSSPFSGGTRGSSFSAADAAGSPTSDTFACRFPMLCPARGKVAVALAAALTATAASGESSSSRTASPIANCDGAAASGRSVPNLQHSSTAARQIVSACTPSRTHQGSCSRPGTLREGGARRCCSEKQRRRSLKPNKRKNTRQKGGGAPMFFPCRVAAGAAASQMSTPPRTTPPPWHARPPSSSRPRSPPEIRWVLKFISCLAKVAEQPLSQWLKRPNGSKSGRK